MPIADLQVMDDLDIAYTPDDYQDQTNPAPPLPGNYKLVALNLVQREKDGQPVLVDERFKIFTIQRVRIVEPTEAAKEFGLFHDIRTKPFDRFGKVASDLMDFTRAMDQGRAWRGNEEGVEVMKELVAQSTPFAVQLAWEAYDADYVRQAFDALGIPKGSEKKALAEGMITKDAYGAIYKQARLSTNDFKPIVKGDGSITRNHVAAGPSGANLEARLRVKKFFPSLETVNLGVFKVKP